MRPPGSNFGRVVNIARKAYIPPKREMSEKTRLRIAIQQASIRYPRARDQSTGDYCFKLAQILRHKKVTEMDETDVAVMVDLMLFEPLQRKRKATWTDDPTPAASSSDDT